MSNTLQPRKLFNPEVRSSERFEHWFGPDLKKSPAEYVQLRETSEQVERLWLEWHAGGNQFPTGPQTLFAIRLLHEQSKYHTDLQHLTSIRSHEDGVVGQFLDRSAENFAYTANIDFATDGIVRDLAKLAFSKNPVIIESISGYKRED